MSRKSCLTLLGILLTPVLVLFVSVLFYWYVPRSKVYYIPQKQVYMQITETVAKPKLDIVLGNTPKLSNSKKYDSFKLDKHSGGNFVINPNENILYFDYTIRQVYDHNGREYVDTIIPDYHLNSVKFKMIEGILYGDMLLYNGKDTSGVPKLKKEYIGVIIHGRNHVSLKASGDSVYTPLGVVW
jgi:hypothetical protein